MAAYETTIIVIYVKQINAKNEVNLRESIFRNRIVGRINRKRYITIHVILFLINSMNQSSSDSSSSTYWVITSGSKSPMTTK